MQINQAKLEAQRRWGSSSLVMEEGGRAAVGSSRFGGPLFIGRTFRDAFKRADRAERRDA